MNQGEGKNVDSCDRFLNKFILYQIGEHSLSDTASPLYDPVSDSNIHPGTHFSDRGASLSHRGAPLSYPVSPVSNAAQSPHWKAPWKGSMTTSPPLCFVSKVSSLPHK